MADANLTGVSLHSSPITEGTPQSSSSTLPSPVSEKEAKSYYAGLPSTPILVARTSTTPWEPPPGPEMYRIIKELRPVGDHPLQGVWEGNFASTLHALLDSMEVKWTSTDVVRIGNRGDSLAPVILWVGVMPSSLSRNDGAVVASKCHQLLVQYAMTDVDVEIRESIVTRSNGLKLLTSTYSSDYTVDVRESITTTLGIPICAEVWAEGTGGFFIEGGNPKKFLLVTARHVVFPLEEDENKLYEYKNCSQPRRKVTLFGDAAFQKYLESIQTGIDGKAMIAQHQELRIKKVEGKDDLPANKERKDAEYHLKKATKAKKELETFYKDMKTHWAAPQNRILGHVILSPPIDFGVGGSGEGCTEDWAVIEVDSSKVDASNFQGNAIDLGTRIPAHEFTRMTYPNPRNAHRFNYPVDRLLRLKGIIPDEEMRNPPAFDQNNDPCIMVIQRGNTTGLTVGRANNIFSYARHHYDGKDKISKEWAILPRDSKSGAFSEKGDSGSVIVDGSGRMGGLLTGGAGATPFIDITYATPISFLLKRMEEHGLHPNLNPVLAA